MVASVENRRARVFALSLLKKFGVHCVPRKRLRGGIPLYDGRRLFIGGLDASDLLHEAAHWLVAAPWRRWLPNYGLGAGFEEPPMVPTVRADDEEMLASVLGIAYERALGLDWIATAHQHDWLEPQREWTQWGDDGFSSTWYKAARRLNRIELLRGLMPTVLP